MEKTVLTIKGIPTAVVNPEFIEMFTDNMGPEGCAIELVHVFPYLDANTDELRAEGTAIQNMAVFMLLQGCSLGIKWRDTFYFGNDPFYFGGVNLLDAETGYLDEDGTILLKINA